MRWLKLKRNTLGVNQMTKINQEEYEILKGLDDKWEWIARDESGVLVTFESIPRKNIYGIWGSENNGKFEVYISFSSLFQFIQWEHEEPHNIAEMIEEYEGEEGKYEMLLSDFLGRLEESGIDTSRIVIEESEET